MSSTERSSGIPVDFICRKKYVYSLLLDSCMGTIENSVMKRLAFCLMTR